MWRQTNGSKDLESTTEVIEQKGVEGEGGRPHDKKLSSLLPMNGKRGGEKVVSRL